MNSKEIDWTGKTEKEIFKHFENLEQVEKYPFFKLVCRQKSELDFDWSSMFNDHRNTLTTRENIAVCEDFVSWFPQKFPIEYADDFTFIEMDLCFYYLLKDDLTRLRERMTLIIADPVKGIEEVTIKLYFQLLYYGYNKEALKYAKQVYKPIEDSDQIIGSPEEIFIRGIYFDALQQAYEKFRDSGIFDTSEIRKIAREINIEENKDIFRLERESLENALDKEDLLNRVNSDYSRVFIELKMQFLKFMLDRHGFSFMLSEEIWSIIAVKNIFGKSKTRESFFYIDPKKFDGVLDRRLDTFLASNNIEMFGKVWGLHYIYEFLEEHDLIKGEDAEMMQENNLYFRNLMIQFTGEDLWEMSFIFKWPEANLWDHLKPMFEETLNNTHGETRKMMVEFKSLGPVNDRIKKELKIEEERMEQNFFGSNVPYTKSESKINRNDPCPCGSGKKYKKCCLGKK